MTTMRVVMGVLITGTVVGTLILFFGTKWLKNIKVPTDGFTPNKNLPKLGKVVAVFICLNIFAWYFWSDQWKFLANHFLFGWTRLL